MMKSLKFRDQVVENICNEGCKSVNQLLLSIELQRSHTQLQQLDNVDQEWALLELKSVMQVYENSVQLF